MLFVLRAFLDFFRKGEVLKEFRWFSEFFYMSGS